MTESLITDPSQVPKKKSKRARVRDWIIVAFLVFILGNGILNLLVPNFMFKSIVYLSSLGGNVAKDVALPLDRDLVSRGAIKNCEGGDSGHGPDNIQPWYVASYILPVGRSEAINIINEVAAKHGFNLIHATKKDQAALNGMADIYLDDTYFDHTSNPTHVSPGPIYLRFTVPKKALYCSDTHTSSRSDATHTALDLEVTNPRQ